MCVDCPAGKSAEAEARAAEISAARLLSHQNELVVAQSACEELRAASLSLQEQLRYIFHIMNSYLALEAQLRP